MLLSLTLVFTISDSLSNVSLATNRICFVFMLSFFSSLLHVIATSCHFGCMRQLHFPPSISTNLSLHHDQIYNVLLVQNRLSSYLSHRSKLYHIAQFQYSHLLLLPGHKPYLRHCFRQTMSQKIQQHRPSQTAHL